MAQNYLPDNSSPQINAFLTATGWNLKKMMKKLKEEFEKSSFYMFSKIFNFRLYSFLTL